MTTRQVVWELSVEGAERTQTAFNNVAAAERNAGSAFSSVRQGIQQSSQAFSALGSVVGNLSPQLGHAVGIIGQVGNAFSALTAASGPVGIAIAVISTAITVLGPLMSGAADDADQLSGSIRDVGEAAEDVAPSVANYRRVVAQLREEELRVGRSGFTSSPDLNRMREDRDAIEAAEQARQEILDAAGETTAEAAAQQRADDEAAAQQALQDEIAAINARTEAGRRAAAEQEEIRQRSLQEDIEFAAVAEAERQRIELEGIQRSNARFAQEQADKLALIERHQEAVLSSQERLDQELERYHEAELARVREQAQAHQRLSQEIQTYAQPLVSGFVGAMSKVIAGTESAGDAFKGLLSSFLEFISQQAALKAAFEFAEALVSFASLNPVSGAMHLAAGLAFTGVAIAAGAGAIATAPSAGAPASPAANQAPQGGGGNTYNINWNSPVVTAQDNAELGRSLGQLAARSQSRFASRV